MATLHKSADKINQKRKANALAAEARIENDNDNDNDNDDDLPKVSLKPVKRRKDKVRSRPPPSLSPKLSPHPLNPALTI